MLKERVAGKIFGCSEDVYHSFNKAKETLDSTLGITA